MPPLTLVCDCGYEFTKSKKISSVQELSDKIDSIMNEPIEYSKVDGKEPQGMARANQKDAIIEDRMKRVRNLISIFPVPNTKEDIIEFLALAAPNSKRMGGLWGTKIGRIELLSIVVVVISILALIFGGVEAMAIGFGMSALWILLLGGAICLNFDKDSIFYNQQADVWYAKFEQVLMKGRSLRGDMEFQQQLDYYENIMIKYKKEREIKLPWRK